VLKALTGKFTPIRGWLYLDAAEAAPAAALSAADAAPRGDRYDGQAAVFGRAFQARLGALRTFLVGAGAIGCEVLKTWAAMGVACGVGGCVTVTDMDHIERSNLSRQFLFRAAHIGRAKATVAAAAAAGLNADFRARAFEVRVGPDSEGLYNDAFWDAQSGACNALDNVDARLYVDARCVHYGKPLLESGTLGPKGNTQVVVPRLTDNYGASQDPPAKEHAVCTIKSFPFQIEHTLQWARDVFEGEFKQLPDAVNAYVSKPDFLETLAKQPGVQIETLEKVRGGAPRGARAWRAR
jgi:ubiquitin-activating enzyme E1